MENAIQNKILSLNPMKDNRPRWQCKHMPKLFPVQYEK